MKVSVIIPVYNVAPWLKYCLNSVINQTLKDLEIICVNDASTDSSLEILREYQKMDNRIVVLNHDMNSGLSASRNTGIQYATGEYIYFLDSDDMIKFDALEILYNKAYADKLDVLCFDGETFFENAQLERIYKSEERWCVRSKEYSGIKNGKELFIEMLLGNDYKAVVWILFIKREFINCNRLSFINGILYEDNPFTFEVFLKAKRICHIREKLYVRRVREHSITTSVSTFKRPYGFFVCFTKMLALANECINDVDNSQIYQEVFRMIKCCRNEFRKCSYEEAQKYKALKLVEREMFKYYVADWVELDAQKKVLDKKCSKLLKEKDLYIRKCDDIKHKNIKYLKIINSIKNGWSFRLGRIITWLPRKILGKK